VMRGGWGLTFLSGCLLDFFGRVKGFFEDVQEDTEDSPYVVGVESSILSLNFGLECSQEL